MFGDSQFKVRATTTISTNPPATTPQLGVATTEVVALAFRRLLPSAVMAGTDFNIVILSSSPPTPELYSPQHAPPSSQRVAMHAYSPFAPSPPVSPTKKSSGASALGSKATIVPPEAVRGFATVGSLVRSEHFEQQLHKEVAETQQAQPTRASLEDTREVLTARKSRKRIIKSPATAEGENENPTPKPRVQKPKVGKDNTGVASDPELRTAPIKSSHLAIDVPIEAAGAASTLTKSGKPRKPRAKKEKVVVDTESEPKPKRARVAKPKTTKEATKAAGKTQQTDARTVSAHFGNKEDDVIASAHAIDNHDLSIGDASIWDVPSSPRPKKQAQPKEPHESSAEGLELDEVVVRRRNWTSPRDTATTELQTSFIDSTGKENISSAVDAKASFGSLLTSFAYAQSPSARSTITVANPTAEPNGPAKRRRADLASVPNNQGNSRNSSPDKSKAPKKKPRTITHIVTEKYASKDPTSDLDIVTSAFFQSRTVEATATTTKKVPLNDASDPNGDAPIKKPPRRRPIPKITSENIEPKPKTKRTTANSKAKAKPVVEPLLSPASAVLRVNRQDILFGTSSQLAIEESPTTVRQIQQAIKESERDVDSFSGRLSLTPPRWPKLRKVTGKNNLWDASARDDEGGMLEQMEDVSLPEPDRTQDIPLLMDGTRDEPDRAHEYVDIDNLESPQEVVVFSDPPTPPHLPQLTPHTQRSFVDYVPPGSHTFVDIDNFEQPPPPSNQNAEPQDSFADIDDFDFPSSTQLHFSPLRQAQVSVPVTSNGSPKKRRGRPPKSQSAVARTKASPTTTPKISKSSIAALPVKAKRSPRTPSTTSPRSAGRFIDIEEILDSEDETLEALSPSPPRVPSSPDVPLALSTRPIAFPISTSSQASSTVDSIAPLTTADGITRVCRIPALHLDYIHYKPHLFAQITAHIRAMAPSTDPKTSNWHEKILMYDPIVLEDLTTYLNTYTSIRLYRRATQKQVKAWNKHEKEETKKGKGKAGAKSSRGADGDEAMFSMEGDLQDVLAVERELEATMVRDWCESLSVCAIWGKEGRKKGTARKGFY